MRDQRRQLYTYMGIFLVVLMLLTSILPNFSNNQQPIEAPTLTPQPSATFPPPITDFSTIALDRRYLHPSGLFSVAQPSGWDTANPANNGQQVTVNMTNSSASSVIEAQVEILPSPIESLEALSSHYSSAVLEAGWRGYTNATETGRRIDAASERLFIDFELDLGQQVYLARHVAWLDANGWINVIRVIVPNNARDLLLYLIDTLPATIEPVDLFAGTPTIWTSFYSPQDDIIVRYPNAWSIVDGQQGSTPVTIEGASGTFLNISTEAETPIASAEAAQAYVEGLRSGNRVISVQEATRNGASGYSVAYNFATLDGEPGSGLALVLNDADGTLYVANIRVPGASVDYNMPDMQAEPVLILSTFNLTTDLGLPEPTPEVTPEPTVEVTPAAVVTETAQPAETEAPAAETSAAEAVETPAATEELTPEATDAN